MYLVAPMMLLYGTYAGLFATARCCGVVMRTAELLVHAIDQLIVDCVGRYNRVPADSEGLTFESAELGLFNSTELRAAGFKMILLEEPIRVTAATAESDDSESDDSDDDVAMGSLFALKPQHALPKQIERTILHECW
jgi:hypothetical protein